jgi:hypothetical protein
MASQNLADLVMSDVTAILQLANEAIHGARFAPTIDETKLRIELEELLSAVGIANDGSESAIRFANPLVPDATHKQLAKQLRAILDRIAVDDRGASGDSLCVGAGRHHGGGSQISCDLCHENCLRQQQKQQAKALKNIENLFIPRPGCPHWCLYRRKDPRSIARRAARIVSRETVSLKAQWSHGLDPVWRAAISVHNSMRSILSHRLTVIRSFCLRPAVA